MLIKMVSLTKKMNVQTFLVLKNLTDVLTLTVMGFPILKTAVLKKLVLKNFKDVQIQMVMVFQILMMLVQTKQVLLK